VARVLVVDDDTYSRSLLATLLESQRHIVIEASRAKEALDRASEEPPDLVVLDLDMPGMHGADLVRSLRAAPALNAVTIVLYSATTSGPALDQFMDDNGIRHAIPKPCAPEEILRILSAALGS
jgi:CheY-like chemotaxis protein